MRGFSVSLASLTSNQAGITKTNEKTQLSKMKIDLTGREIIDTFIGNTMATNLSTEISIKLKTDNDNERYPKYAPSLQTNGVRTSPKTESLLIEYEVQKLTTQSTSEKAILVM